jgi:hypothetical protein
MKLSSSIICFLVFLFTGITNVFSQAPQKFKYQSIARNASGLELASSPIGIRFSVRDLSVSGTIVYQETHAVTTNTFGLFSINVGEGTASIGTIGSVDWANGSKYLEVEADLTGGTSYTPFGTSELLSVPYALYAHSSGTPLLPVGNAPGNTPYWDGSAWIVNSSNIYNNGGFVGIGTATPVQRLHVNGNMNIVADSSYMINNRKILWANGTANLFVGFNAGSSNTIGFNNSFIGYNSGILNSVGSQNTFVGTETGSANIDGMMNSFLGRRAGFSNTNGNENTFIGAYAGQSNTEGLHNSFLGVTTGSANTLGSENTFIGAHAGYFNDLGSYNTFIGNFAGEANTSGNYNTFLGFEADASSGNLTNASALGYGAVVNSSNSVIIGNTSVTSIGGQVSWSTFSDKRLKKNIRPNELGLNFISRLEPVYYNYKAEGQQGIEYSGLIAQDVEKILTDLNASFSGIVKPTHEKDYYSIRYGDFVIPLINAVQEQQVQIQQLQQENLLLLKRLESIEKKMNDLNKK